MSTLSLVIIFISILWGFIIQNLVWLFENLFCLWCNNS